MQNLNQGRTRQINPQFRPIESTILKLSRWIEHLTGPSGAIEILPENHAKPAKTIMNRQ